MKELAKSFINSINNLYNKALFRRNQVAYEQFPAIKGIVYLVNKGKLHIGKNVKINSRITVNPIGGDTKTILFVNREGALSIGSNVGISNSTIFCEKKIVIKDNVVIGGNCKIYDTDFHPIDWKERLTEENHYENTKRKEVIIEENVFIGGHVIVLKGVTIGRNAVIGAGSVVTRNVPANEIWGGNPAVFLRKLD